MASSTFFQNMALNFVLRGEGGSPPSSLFLALLTADPSVVGMSEEVAAVDYERKSISFTSSTDGLTQNENAVDFGTTASDWGEISYYAIVDAQVGGNALIYGELNVLQAPLGTAVNLPAKSLSVEMD